MVSLFFGFWSSWIEMFNKLSQQTGTVRSKRPLEKTLFSFTIKDTLIYHLRYTGKLATICHLLWVRHIKDQPNPSERNFIVGSFTGLFLPLKNLWNERFPDNLLFFDQKNRKMTRYHRTMTLEENQSGLTI